MEFMRACIVDLHGKAGVLTHNSTANAGPLGLSYFTTTDGIAAGGARLATEVRAVLKKNPSLTHLSFVGVSLGGLYVRAALEHLVDLPLARTNLITFASPHLGVRNHLLPVIAAAVAAGAIGRTGWELLLMDRPTTRETAVTTAAATSTQRRMLEWLADPDSSPWRELHRFANRVCVANLEDDDKVPYWSAALVTGSETLHRLAREGLVHACGPPTKPLSADGTAESADVSGTYPHVIAEHRQLQQPSAGLSGIACDGTSSVTVGHGSARSGGPRGDVGGVASGSGAAEAFGSDGLPPLEARLAAQLRSMGGWVNVDVRFTEWPAYLTNHLRIAVSRPGISALGSDVAWYVARHHFLLRREEGTGAHGPRHG